MDILVFKTDIKTKRKTKELNPVFAQIPSVTRWTVDTQDVDNVLRVVTIGGLLEKDVENLVSRRGFFCQALQD